MNCKNCKQELVEYGEIDKYELCHICYCKIMDTTTNTNEGETR
jgi:hypothetical protein